MARDNPITFRKIPPHADYPGLTAIPTTGTKELVALGVGPAVEAMLIERLVDYVGSK